MCETFAGGVNAVRRVDDDIIRPRHPWTANVHGLLRHLADSGVSTVPRVRELRAHTERLSFIPGHVSNYPLSREASKESVLASAARMLREYHDATVDYVPQHDSGWQLPTRAPVEVLCHGDFAPYNVVVRNGEAVGIIDFDTVHPGPKIWDVAYAVYRWSTWTAESNPDGYGRLEQQAIRARAFCDAYGLPVDQRGRLVDTARERLEALIAFIRSSAADGDPAYERHIHDGHVALYETDIAFLNERHDYLTDALTSNAGA